MRNSSNGLLSLPLQFVRNNTVQGNVLLEPMLQQPEQKTWQAMLPWSIVQARYDSVVFFSSFPCYCFSFFGGCYRRAAIDIRYIVLVGTGIVLGDSVSIRFWSKASFERDDHAVTRASWVGTPVHISSYLLSELLKLL